MAGKTIYELPALPQECAVYKRGRKLSVVTLSEAEIKRANGGARKMRELITIRALDYDDTINLPLYRVFDDTDKPGTNVSSRMSPRIPMKKFVDKTRSGNRSFRIRHFQKQGVGAYEALLDSPDSLTEHHHKNLKEGLNCKACTMQPWRFPYPIKGISIDGFAVVEPKSPPINTLEETAKNAASVQSLQSKYRSYIEALETQTSLERPNI